MSQPQLSAPPSKQEGGQCPSRRPPPGPTWLPASHSYQVATTHSHTPHVSIHFQRISFMLFVVFLHIFFPGPSECCTSHIGTVLVDGTDGSQPAKRASRQVGGRARPKNQVPDRQQVKDKTPLKRGQKPEEVIYVATKLPSHKERQPCGQCCCSPSLPFSSPSSR